MRHTCTVYWKDSVGKQWGHVVEAETVFGAARRALEYFRDPHWKGPRPSDETLLRVRTVADQEKSYYVRVKSISPDPPQAKLFEPSGSDAFG